MDNKAKNSPVRAVAYCRFSSEMQRDGYSIEAQSEAIRKYCSDKGYILGEIYIDRAKSGTNDHRPNFQRMIDDSKSRAFDLVVIHKLDRFSRNRADFAVYKKILKKNGVRVESVLERLDDTPESIIMEGLLESMAEYYSANLSREVKKGNHVAAEKGMVLGQLPMGYVKGPDKRFAVDPERSKLVKELFDRVASGEPVIDVVKSWEARSIKGQMGKPVSYQSAKKILRNTLYRGDFRYGDNLYEGVVPPIVSHETFALANSKIADRRGKHFPKHRQEEYSLTGLLYCGICGSTMTGHSIKAKDGKVTAYYRCHHSTVLPSKERCPMKLLRKDETERVVLEAMERLCHEPSKMWKDLASQLNARILARQEKSDVPALEKSKSEAERKRTRLLDAYVDGAIELSVYHKRDLTLQAELAKCALAISRANGSIPPTVTGEDIRGAFLYFFEQNKNPANMDRARLFRIFVSRIVAYPDKISIDWNFGGSSDLCARSEPRPCAFHSFAHRLPRLVIRITYAIPNWRARHVHLGCIEDYTLVSSSLES